MWLNCREMSYRCQHSLWRWLISCHTHKGRQILCGLPVVYCCYVTKKRIPFFFLFQREQHSPYVLITCILGSKKLDNFCFFYVFMLIYVTISVCVGTLSMRWSPSTVHSVNSLFFVTIYKTVSSLWPYTALTFHYVEIKLIIDFILSLFFFPETMIWYGSKPPLGESLDHPQLALHYRLGTRGASADQWVSTLTQYYASKSLMQFWFWGRFHKAFSNLCPKLKTTL